MQKNSQFLESLDIHPGATQCCVGRIHDNNRQSTDDLECSKSFEKIMQLTATRKSNWCPLTSYKTLLEQGIHRNDHCKSGICSMRQKEKKSSGIGTVFRWKNKKYQNSVLITNEGDIFFIHKRMIAKINANSEILKKMVACFGPCESVDTSFDNLLPSTVNVPQKLPLLFPTFKKSTKIDLEEPSKSFLPIPPQFVRPPLLK